MCSSEEFNQKIGDACPKHDGPIVVTLNGKTDNGLSRECGISQQRKVNMSTNIMMAETRSRKREPRVVSEKEWIAARKELLKKEKAATQLRDELSAERRKLPWVKVDKNYVFDGPGGKVALIDLFAGRSQLVIYHFMFGPDWQEGCPSCSFVSDHLDGTRVHLAARDVSLVLVSRAPLAKIAAFKQRMGWQLQWVSAHDNDFNADFHVSFTPEEMAQGKVNYNYTMQEFPSAEAPGLSVFYKDDHGDIFHTYSTFSRGLDPLLSTYVVLDFVPKGRDEELLDFSMAWLRHHDRYGTNEFADADKPYWPETTAVAPASNCGCGSAKEHA